MSNEVRGVDLRSIVASMVLLVMALSIGSVILMEVDGEPTAVIDEDNITVDKEQPKYSDNLTITAPVVLVDADLVSVNLEWKLCTETACNIPVKNNMTDNGDSTYSVMVGGPFEEKDSNGDPYIDIGFTIEVTYTAIGGGEEKMVESEEITVLFNITAPSDDDDAPDDDDTEEKKDDSPLGLEIIFAGIIIAVGIFALRRKK